MQLHFMQISILVIYKLVKIQFLVRIKICDMRRMKSTEMRILRMICGKTVRDKVRNEEIRERTEVESIEEHFRKQRLRWFGYMEKMDCERQ